MTPNIFVQPEAEEDINDAFLWYETQSVGLGTDFIRSIDASFEAIARTPELHSRIHQKIRRALVRRFPYCVYYLFEPEKIVILAVMHAARHPRRWQNRL